MTLNYKLDLSDYLEYQLYTSSQSKSIKKKRNRARFIVPIIYLVCGLIILNIGNNILGMGFLLFGLAWFLFYPVYSKNRFKKHYENHIKENYKNRFNKEIEVEFSKDYIYTKDFVTESKIKTTELINLVELKNHFLLKIKTEESLIIPKHAISEVDKLNIIMDNYYVEKINELDWKWK